MVFSCVSVHHCYSKKSSWHKGAEKNPNVLFFFCVNWIWTFKVTILLRGRDHLKPLSADTPGWVTSSLQGSICAFVDSVLFSRVPWKCSVGILTSSPAAQPWSFVQNWGLNQASQPSTPQTELPLCDYYIQTCKMIKKKMDYTAPSKADMKHEKLAPVLNHFKAFRRWVFAAHLIYHSLLRVQ